jgi:hypothetical protein
MCIVPAVLGNFQKLINRFIRVRKSLLYENVWKFE